jgi:hypothetical protein
MEERENIRDQGDPDSKANQEQKQILDSINKIGTFIDQYKGSLEDNHILNEITSYDKVIKDYDRMFVDKDTKLF